MLDFAAQPAMMRLGCIQLITLDTRGWGPMNEKQAAVQDARVCLMRVGGLFATDDQLADDLDKLADSGRVPSFVELAEVARRHRIDFTPDLVAYLAVTGLNQWSTLGAERLSAASHVEFSELDGDPRRIDLLRSWLNACAELAGYYLGGDTGGGPVSTAFRMLGLLLLEWEPDIAVACGLGACGLAVDGQALLSAADALLTIAGQRDDKAARAALAYRVLGMYRLHRQGAAVKLELYDAFEAACRYPPTGPPKENAGAILGQVFNELEFLRPHWFLWQCAFDPDGLDPRLELATPYAQPVWHFDYAVLVETIRAIGPIVADLENRRLDLMSRNEDTVAFTDLTNWSIDYKAFRRAIPFARSLLRETDWSEILLTLSHEVIHIQSALGWLGVNLAALRTAATECELTLLRAPDELPAQAEQAQSPEPRLAVLAGQDLRVLALVEQQLELVRKSQLLRAIWLPWLEGIAVFGELSADPSLDSERYTMFSDVVSSMNEASPAEVAAERGLSIEDASRAIRADAERLYADALRDGALAKLRTYLSDRQGRYLAGYLAVRAVLTSLRRSHPFNGLSAYQALFDITTISTSSAVPSLTLPPAEFEAQARAGMLEWLHRISDLDESSVTALATAPVWKWVDDGARSHVLEADAPSPASLSDVVPPLALDARVPRTGRENEFSKLPPELAASVGRVLDVVAGGIPAAYEQNISALAGYLGDRISLVPLAQVTAPFWLSLGGPVPTLAVSIRVTETERELGRPSYAWCTIPLKAEQVELLQDQMRLVRSSRMEVRRYADITHYVPGGDQGRGLGRNVLGFAYGSFTLVIPVGQLTNTAASPSLRTSAENRLRPPSILELDATVMTGTAIARRAIDWIGSRDFAGDTGLAPQIEAWTAQVLALAIEVLAHDDSQLVAETSALIVAELGWADGEYARVCKSGLRALYDDDSPVLSPLLDAALVSAAGVCEADVDDIPERVTSLLFESTEHGHDFRRFRRTAS